ncbi:MAG: hypothetical protein IJU16_08350, partial [Clostridia bacterium]|nr:hypothetical protein [Clostridia bacterium]
MREIKEFIHSSQLELEKNNQGMNIVGNRPHYPMFLLFNDPFDAEIYGDILAKLGRVWPQSLQHIVSYRYTFAGGGITYTDFRDGSAVSEETVLTAIDREQQVHDTFADMMELLIYNIVDTSSLSSLEDFRAHYQLVETTNRLLDCKKKTMLIVLLNDSLAKRTLAKEIREYLSAANQYDSTILISTRTRNNEVFAMPDLYRIVPSILLLSNNDAVATIDDDDYRSRYAKLYNCSTYTLSYVLCEKPNHKIATQMNDIIIEQALQYVRTVPTNDVVSWNKKFGIENGKCQLCETFIADLNVQVDPDFLRHLPVKAGAVEKHIDFLSCPYKVFREFSYEDTIVYFSENYCKSFVISGLNFRNCVEEFRDFVCHNVSPAELVELDDATLNQIFDLISTGSLNEELTLPEYVKRQIEIHIRRAHVLPQFKEVIKQLRENSKKVIAAIEDLQAKYRSIIPINQEELGAMYKTLTENYFLGAQGKESLVAICSAGNTTADIFRELQQCFVKVVNANQSIFSLPFIEEWERRLDLTGDRIYREISKTLTEKADDLIRLYGNLPISKA